MAKIDPKKEKLRKAAIIVTSLERKDASVILRSLTPELVQAIMAEVQELGEIMPEERDRAFHEFATRLEQGVNPHGGADVARELLQDVMGDTKARELLDQGARQAFSSIADVSDVDLAAILSKEQPSVVAMILAFLAPKKVAGILAHLDPDSRGEIINRLVHARSTDPEIVARIERIFVDKVVSMIHTTKRHQNDLLGGTKFVANVFQFTERSVEDELLQSIQQASPEKAEQVRDLMFTFEDVVRLRDQDVQKMLRQIQLDKLVVALKGVSPMIHEKIIKNLSKHAQQTIKEEMELLGRVKLADVEMEQRNIVNVVRSLEAAGEIKLRPDEKEEVYV